MSTQMFNGAVTITKEDSNIIIEVCIMQLCQTAEKNDVYYNVIMVSVHSGLLTV